MMMKFTIPAVFLLVAAVSAETYQVTVAPGGQLRFQPSSLQIKVGDTVRFNFASGPHTVTHGGCGSNGGAFDFRSTNAYTFSRAGTFPFHCAIDQHCRMGMLGSITVSGSDNPSPSPPPAPAPAPAPGPTPAPPPAATTTTDAAATSTAAPVTSTSTVTASTSTTTSSTAATTTAKPNAANLVQPQHAMAAWSGLGLVALLL